MYVLSKVLKVPRAEIRGTMIRTRRFAAFIISRRARHPSTRSSPHSFHSRGEAGLASCDDFRRTKRRAALTDITPRRHFHTKRPDNAKFYASGGLLRVPALSLSSFPPRGAPESMNSNMIMRTSADESSRGRRLIGFSTVEGWIYGMSRATHWFLARFGSV